MSAAALWIVRSHGRGGSRAGGLHSRTLELLDQRGIVERFLAEGQKVQVAGFAGVTEQWELPVVGAIGAPSAVLIRPDGYVAWVGDQTQAQLVDALTKWFGPPATVSRVTAAVVRQVSRNF